MANGEAAAGHEIAVWHAADEWPPNGPSQEFSGQFSHALPPAGVPNFPVPRAGDDALISLGLMAKRHEADRRVGGGVGGPGAGWVHLRLLQCSLRLMSDLVFQ